MAYMAQYIGLITTEVAPSKLPSITTRGRVPVILDTIKEEDKEAVESPMAHSSPHKAIRGMEVVTDTPMHCANKLTFLAGPMGMANTGCMKIRA
ncbi:hypothetical protein QOZ80_8AG0619980 [Eleusine coracana subsp. coracana]|nr:hypothetical protein QOZ80_8AG0619980 [Eleusine coracana subsp. coracana]